MHRTFILIALALGCEGAHPATEPAQRFVDALLYGDRERLFDAHIDSTDQGEFCRSEFRTVLAKAQADASTEDCQRVRTLKASDLDAMSDELRLAVQVTRWSCENPQGTCVDYARLVFEQALESHPLVAHKPTEVTIRRVFGDESTAAAYVDVVRADGSREHRTLELRHVGAGWRVAKGFLTP